MRKIGLSEDTFYKYQAIYLDFLDKKAASGCSQKEYCQASGVSTWVLSRIMQLVKMGKADFSQNFPHFGQPAPGSSDTRSAVSCPSDSLKMEFWEVVL